ncbi:MAG: hypothetical protein HYZ49_17685 [Chloroflexi bacterium]|nr:hypothetical protein [Chloroflexota bacterium]
MPHPHPGLSATPPPLLSALLDRRGGGAGGEAHYVPQLFQGRFKNRA